MSSRTMQPKPRAPADLVGAFRRFGPWGPVYQIVGLAPSHGGEARLRIRVVESGEEADYSYAAALADPEAA